MSGLGVAIGGCGTIGAKRADSFAMDASAEAAWERLSAELRDVHGLVCAASVLDPIGTCSVADFRRALEVNVIGTLLAIATCLAALRHARGAVVTFSAAGATAPVPRFGAYAASNAAGLARPREGR
jgi:NAD(P)-dependent dehydrogenase (short-subunit alcohol dehydrogenase family)